MNIVYSFINRFKNIPIALYWLVFIAVLLKFSASFPDKVETWYSQGIYHRVAVVFRFLTGWLPFSVGDLLYVGFVVYVFYGFYKVLVSKVPSHLKYQFWIKNLYKICSVSLFIYVSFNLFWGLNYDRKGVATQFNFNDTTVDAGSLVHTIELIHEKLNQEYKLAIPGRPYLKEFKLIFNQALTCYDSIKQKVNFLSYSTPSVKPSLFGVVGNYMGYSGYYNPFSGEAQVNTTVPNFILPFTTCHEIAHQLGYAKEQEANFIGFLAAKSSDNASFRYAVYFELYLYSRPYLYRQDSVKLRQLDNSLLPGVKKDIKHLKEFYNQYKSPVEDWVDRFYEEYLKANEQPEGQKAYGKVMIWLVEYVRRYGDAAL